MSAQLQLVPSSGGMARCHLHILGALLLATIDYALGAASSCEAADLQRMINHLPDEKDPRFVEHHALAELRRALQERRRAVPDPAAAPASCIAPPGPRGRSRRYAAKTPGQAADFIAQKTQGVSRRLQGAEMDLTGISPSEKKAIVPSMLFPYRRGPIVQAFAGMGVKGPSVDGLDPNHTFLDYPVGLITDTKTTGNILFTDEGSHRIQTLVNPYYQSPPKERWNVMTLADGKSWRTVTEADREIPISMRTFTALIQYRCEACSTKDWIYAVDHDTGRILRITATNQSRNATNPSDIEIIANSAGKAGMSGDCGPATLATTRRPQGLAVIPARKSFDQDLLAFTDTGNNRVRTIELTDWPSCIVKTCKEPTAKIKQMNSTIDMCAFWCRESAQQSGGLNPQSPVVRFPEKDVTVTGDTSVKPPDDQLDNELFKGCQNANGDKDAYLFACHTSRKEGCDSTKVGIKFDTATQEKCEEAEIDERRVPSKLMYFTLYKAFTFGGVTVKSGSRLLGAVVGGRLMPLRKDQLKRASFMTAEKGKFSVTLRFHSKPEKCMSWYWTPFPGSAMNGVNNSLPREGKCSLSSAAVDCTSGTGRSGISTCRPGKMQTLMGGGGPGLPVVSSPVGQKYVDDPLKMRLAKPTDLLLMNAGQHGELMRDDHPKYTLLVTDTANSRILGLPMVDHRKFHTRFWLFLRGDFSKMNESNPMQAQLHSKLLYWSLGASVTWDYDWTPVNLGAVVAAVNQSLEGANDDNTIKEATCNVENNLPKSERDLFKTEAGYSTQIGEHMCEQTACDDPFFKLSGFANTADCQKQCKSIFELGKCGLKISLFAASVASYGKCVTLTNVLKCLNKNKPNPPLATFNVYHFMDSVLTLPPNKAKSSTKSYSESLLVKQGSASKSICDEILDGGIENTMGCNGMCDKYISKILQVDNTFLDAPVGKVYPDFVNASNKETRGYLFDITSFSEMDNAELSTMVAAMKTQELGAYNSFYKNVSTKTFPQTFPQASQITGEPDENGFVMWKEFVGSFNYILKNLMGGLNENSFRPAISSLVHWLSDGRNNFDGTEKVRAGTAYWLAGSGGFYRTGYNTDFKNPTGMAIDKAQRLYIADSGNYRILRLENIWHAKNFSAQDVGTGFATFNGNGDLASETSLKYPRGLTMDHDGTLHFTDVTAHDIRQVLGLTWNRQCTSSQSYYDSLTNPQKQDLDAASNMVSCRLAAVKAITLSLIRFCSENCGVNSQACNFQKEENKECTVTNGKVVCVYKCEADPAKCPSCNKNEAKCPRSKFMSLCKKRPAAELGSRLGVLWDSLKADGSVSCSSDTCPKMNGCELPEANFVYNMSDDRTPNPIDWTIESEFSWNTDVLSVKAIELLNNAIATLKKWEPTQGQDYSTWSGTDIKDKLEGCINANGDTLFQNALEETKTSLKCGNSNPEAEIGMARILFWQWFAHVSDVCIFVADNAKVDRKTLPGAQFYNRMSNIATGVFWSKYEAATHLWKASTCTPKCDILHPRFFGNTSANQFLTRDDPSQGGEVARLPKVSGSCCNNGDGSPGKGSCGEGEGPCQLNSDCDHGLVCGTQNCIWGKGENCCTKIEFVQGFERMRDFSVNTGTPMLGTMDKLLR